LISASADTKAAMTINEILRRKANLPKSCI
jgi:hypothetical protein